MRRAPALPLICWLLFGGFCAAFGSDDLPPWAKKIRQDHPRLFFNAETWPEVRRRALGPRSAWWAKIRSSVDRQIESRGADRSPAEPTDDGRLAAWAAFTFRMTGQAKYRDFAISSLERSLDYYDTCFEARKSVDWYAVSRVHAICAWDWLHGALSEEDRSRLLRRLVVAVDRVLEADPPIYRENMSGHDTGFYGVKNCLWFLGLTGFGEGVETDRIDQWLVWGHDENLRMLAHRARACGDDGGGASPTLGYVFGAYPWAEQNFFYTWRSSTGENIAPDWPHSAWLANYVIWNWIEAVPQPLQFGYGDTPHLTNELPTARLYTHMANIDHLFGEADPTAVALARHLQERLPQRHARYLDTWFVYPFLHDETDDALPALEPKGLPLARHFETMGQVFMRSGTSEDDTYCLFTCGGILRQHRHYDALNFVIYHRGFLALDSGTRANQFANGQHLANYYAQTVAHNCVVVHQPGEPPARYWGGTVEGNHGGQHHQLGSVVKAFIPGERFVYVAGDATPCYQHGVVQREGQSPLPEKCTHITRQVVFLPPRHFVVFDRVTSTSEDYRKDWLLHTALEPRIREDIAMADHRQGRMFCRTLLPRDAEIAKVGGPGKEFWAAGKNWDLKESEFTEEHLQMMGQWRIEVTPGKARLDDVFLHLIEVGAAESFDKMDQHELIESDSWCGVRVFRDGEPWTVRFARQGPLRAHLACEGEQSFDEMFSEQVQPQSGVSENAK